MTKKSNKQLNIKDLLAKKEQIIDSHAKSATMQLYVKSLDGEVTIQRPERSTILEAADMENPRGDIYTVYQCVVEPNLKSSELQEAFGCVEPLDIVDKLFLPGEVSNIAMQAIQMAGYGEKSVTPVDDLKN